MYPDDAMRFIMLREKAKRIRYDAEVIAQKMQGEGDGLFQITGAEQLVNTDILGSVPISTQSSPEKINFNCWYIEVITIGFQRPYVIRFNYSIWLPIK